MTPNEMASIFGHQENSNQNELRFFLTPFRMAKMKTTNNSYVGEDVKQGEISSIAVTVQTYTTTQEVSVAIIQKSENKANIRSSYTNLVHKGFSIIQEHLLIAALFFNARKLKQPR